MSKSILYVDDAADERRVLQEVIRQSDHELGLAASIAEALEALSSRTYDLLILDVLLPDGTGFELYRQISEKGYVTDTPVIFLTAKGDIEQKLIGFEMGAVDYIVKPFHPKELLARVNTHLKVRPKKSDVMQLEGLKLEVHTLRGFKLKDKKWMSLSLTPNEFRLLAYLVKNRDQTFSRKELIDDVWGSGYHVSERTIDTHLSNLRKKINGSGLMIKAIHGVGYQLTSSKSSLSSV